MGAGQVTGFTDFGIGWNPGAAHSFPHAAESPDSVASPLGGPQAGASPPTPAMTHHQPALLPRPRLLSPPVTMLGERLPTVRPAAHSSVEPAVPSLRLTIRH